MNKPITGILLAAGMGTRLGNITTHLPKSIVPVGDKPLIWYAIHLMRRLGVDRIIVIGGFEYEILNFKKGIYSP